jgi:hypothetical protein
MKRLPLLLAALVCGSMIVPCGTAQVVDISGCRAISDRLDRFDCYENLGDGPLVQPSRGAEMPVVTEPDTRDIPVESNAGEAETVYVSSPDPVDGFGRESTDSVAVVSGTGDSKELQDTIAALEQSGPNLWTVTLSSGQKWRQMVSKPYRLQVGDPVRIYQSFWGKSYRLSAPRLASFIQVQRVE